MTEGTLTVVGEHDWLAVQLTAGQAYTISLDGLSELQRLEVGVPGALDEGVVAFASATSTAAAASPSTAFFRPDQTGTYYVDVSDPGSNTGSYTVSAVAVGTDYANDTSTTGSVAVGGSTTGSLSVAGEHDWLAVQLTAGQAYTISLAGLSDLQGLEIGTASALDEGLISFGSASDTQPVGTPVTAFFRPDTTGTYYVDVSDPGSTTGSYTVSAATVSAGYTNDTSTTGSVAVGGSATGSLSVADEHDWLALQLTAGQAYAISLDGLSDLQALEIGTASALDEGVVSFGSASDTQSAGTPVTAFFRPDTTGTYYVDVSDPGSTTGSYTISAVAVSTVYANDTSTTGSVAVGGSATGSLSVAGEHDWLAVQLTAGQAYTVSLSGLSDLQGLEIGTSSALDEGVVSFGSASETQSTGTPVTAFFRPDTTGTYYVDVSDPGSTTGSYTVSAAAVSTDFTNNTSTTGSVAVGGSATGSLSVAGEHDWLAVQLTAGQAYTLSVNNGDDLEVGTAAVLDEGLVATGSASGATGAAGTSTAFFRPDTSGTYYVDISDPGSTSGSYTVDVAAVSTITTNNTSTTGTVTVACYCPGTAILTDQGERPIEELAIGDRVITQTGAAEPIRWIGRRSYLARFAAANPELWPVRIQAGALGERVPWRDLFVSPRHALLLDGLLVPAATLVNGASITQSAPSAELRYIHLELQSHDAIWAEGVLAETFVDDHSRAMFHNAHEYAALFPHAEPTQASYCAPRVEHGYQLDAIRRRIEGRAGLQRRDRLGELRGFLDEVTDDCAVGWAQSIDYPEMPVLLEVLLNGTVIAEVLANRYRPDLHDAGLGSGRHAFRVDLPPRPRGEPRVVTVRRVADGAPLTWLAESRAAA